MFLHMLRRGLTGRGNRPLIAFIALTVAATMISAMLVLYSGLESKLNRDFRAYGANITVAAAEGEFLPESVAAQARGLLQPGSIVVPFAFAIAHTQDGRAVVVAGTDMEQARTLNRWWLVSSWPSADDQALVGTKAESRIGVADGNFNLTFGNKVLPLKLAGTLKTGAEEENRIYLSLATFERWTAIKPSLLEINASGSRGDVSAAIRKLQTSFPKLQVRPVRQLLEAQGAVVERMRSVMLASTLLITLTVALCVLSTLTSSVLERRRDFAVMKAIGSSQRTVNALFAGEALSIAFAASLIGFLLGSGLAAWISQVNFHTVVYPRAGVLPIVILAGMALALVAALFPLAQLQRIEPAGILKGE